MTAVLLIFWSARTLRALMRAVSLWQVKEYRLDRLRAHLRLPSTRGAIVRPPTLVKVVLAAAGLGLAPWEAPASATIVLALLWGYETGLFARDVISRSLHRPRPTARALAVCAGSIAFLATSFALLTTAGTAVPLALLLTDLGTPLAVAAAVALTALPAHGVRRRAFRDARRAIRARPNLLTIGITGSYGKTSTKEILRTILATRFQVQTTPEHVNTEIGIANFVRRHLRPNTEVLVCEMGAYREGEIARSCAITRPRIGVLTAIGTQHLDLFGSRAAIVRAKGELLRALPHDGTAIANADQEECRAAAARIRAREVLRFGHGTTADVRAEDVKVGPRDLTVRIRHGADTATLTVPLLGHLQVPNLLAATAVARVLGMTLPDIAEAARNMRPLPRTMEPIDRPDGVFVVDDTYSANLDGVLAALEYLRHADRVRQVVVLQPMIELGDTARGAHRQVGERLGDLRPDLTVLTGNDYADEIVAGVTSRHPDDRDRVRVLERLSEALAAIAAATTVDTVLLLEGRVPETLRLALRGSRVASPAP